MQSALSCSLSVILLLHLSTQRVSLLNTCLLIHSVINYSATSRIAVLTCYNVNSHKLFKNPKSIVAGKTPLNKDNLHESGLENSDI